MELSPLGYGFCSLSLWRVCQSCYSPTFNPGSPAYLRLVQVLPSQWAASSNRHVLLRLSLASPHLLSWVLLSQGTEQWFPYTFNVEQCGVPPTNAGLLPGSALLDVGPCEEMLGCGGSKEAKPGVWSPSPKWITCFPLIVPGNWLLPIKLRDCNIWIRTCGVGRDYSIQWPKYLHLLSRQAFYFQLKFTCQGYLNIREGYAVSGLARGRRMSQSQRPSIAGLREEARFTRWEPAWADSSVGKGLPAVFSVSSMLHFILNCSWKQIFSLLPITPLNLSLPLLLFVSIKCFAWKTHTAPCCFALG